MDFQQQHLALNTGSVRERDLLERLDSCNSTTSSLLGGGGGRSRKSTRVPPSPVSVLHAFSRFSSFRSSSASGSERHSMDLYSSTSSDLSRSFSMASRHGSSSSLVLDSIDELEDNTLVPVYSRQSSSRSLVSNTDSQASACSVEWLNCYATSILVPDSKDSSPIKEASQGLERYTGSPGCPKRSRRQLACQLDDLIHSMDDKIRLSIAESQKRKNGGASATDDDVDADARQLGASASGFYDDDDDDDDAFSDSEEFAIDLVDDGDPLIAPRTIDNFWWYNQRI
mmetsp:Transcript_17953/g.36933  ORF Transcript_17953/g.36933 Transcript_17953/m.36933 type:complete len:284 (+) Transcript_17953:241-1092(+)